MKEQFYTTLTAIGKAKIANATALGNKVNFTTLKIGDSNGKYYNPTESQEDLVNTLWEGNINSISVDEKNPNWIVIEVIIPSNVGGFVIREAGIFDDEDDLIAIGKYPETYKPKAEDGSTKDLIIKMILEVSNNSSITLKVDPTVILASKKDIEVLESKIQNIKVLVTSVNSKTGEVKLKAEDIKTNSGETVESQLADMTQQIENIDLSADKIKIADKNNKFNSTEVEGALYECITKAEEAFIGADNGKKNWVDVIGSPLSKEDSFSTLKSKTQTLKNTFASNLSSKKVSASGTESLNNLINKIKNINTGLKYATGRKQTDGEYNVDLIVRNLSFRPFLICGVSDVENFTHTPCFFYIDKFNIQIDQHRYDEKYFSGLGDRPVYDESRFWQIFQDGFETSLFSASSERYFDRREITWLAIGE